tara:strand:- start:160 stop:285 length:126 start_codon:yes stop_codon:yes gene_type:complete
MNHEVQADYLEQSILKYHWVEMTNVQTQAVVTAVVLELDHL